MVMKATMPPFKIVISPYLVMNNQLWNRTCPNGQLNLFLLDINYIIIANNRIILSNKIE